MVMNVRLMKLTQNKAYEVRRSKYQTGFAFNSSQVKSKIATFTTFHFLQIKSNKNAVISYYINENLSTEELCYENLRGESSQMASLAITERNQWPIDVLSSILQKREYMRNLLVSDCLH
ncbi:uncharacterized protein LOC111618074 [Centruroides sculpturatus]|uniref:uncharacterized protein LOC111618074 n=1 Tax=Centruroides sculpturatus TaxID=218467 RepID=UPI000C6E824E|nr:uncharacterized protein LOC111618074 [Centruroides sculpturatus]